MDIKEGKILCTPLLLYFVCILLYLCAHRISEGTDPIHFYNVKCRDDDILLARCHYLENDNDCSHQQDVAVICCKYFYRIHSICCICMYILI